MDFKPDIMQQALLNDLSFRYDGLAGFRSEVLISTLLKKFAGPIPDASLHRDAVASFEARNLSLTSEFKVPNHRADLFLLWKNRIYDIVMSGEYQSSRLTLASCLSNGYAGPGASRGTRHSNFLDKMFNSQLTTTSEFLLKYYQLGLSDRWSYAESLRNKTYSYKVVSGNALSSVPKDARKNRCICTEPSLNMFFQLGAKEVINSLLTETFHLNVSEQPEINKRLARLGSIDGSNATLDLKDASDSIHYDLCKQLFPSEFFNVLDVIRSSTYEVDGRVETLNMISSMGNGFTFSLMTLMLTSLLDVFLRTKGSRYTFNRDGVFGDDIILPSKYAAEFSLVLSDFGFVVNLDKSYIDGFFRESCGGDYLHGHNVRGVYIKGINNEADVYSAFNRLHEWSIRTGIPLPSSLHYLKGLVDFRPIPLHEAENGGFRIPLEQTTARKTDRNGSVVYHCLSVRPVIRRVGDLEPNPHGALIAFLGGYVQGHRMMLRNNSVVRLKVIRKVTPNWNFLLHPGLTSRDYAISWDSLLEAA